MRPVNAPNLIFVTPHISSLFSEGLVAFSPFAHFGLSHTRATSLAELGAFFMPMRLYEYKLSTRIYGKNKPDLCYRRAQNRYYLYNDSTSPRTEIAQVFWGDKGWTYAGQALAPNFDTFANAKQAMFGAFSQYLHATKK